MSALAVRRRRKSSGDCMHMICRGLSIDHSALEPRRNFAQTNLPLTPPSTPTKSVSQATHQRIAEARKKWKLSRGSRSSLTSSFTTSPAAVSLSCPRAIFKSSEHQTPRAVKEGHHDEPQAYQWRSPTWSLPDTPLRSPTSHGPDTPPHSPTSRLPDQTPRPSPVIREADLVRRTIVDNTELGPSPGKLNRMSSVTKTLKRNASLMLPKAPLPRLQEHDEHQGSAQQHHSLLPLRERPLVGRRAVSDEAPHSHSEFPSTTQKCVASMTRTLKRSASAVVPKLHQLHQAKLLGSPEQTPLPRSRPRRDVDEKKLRTSKYEDTSQETKPPIPY
ncbi:uncharacterized protein EI97DRAFT_278996 [Westerdykella ornata]|uniref:Uncharacterized protein n=1 Tax=Westerdykella ornata TaxID=318751 RepID=A0A6A6JN64_WESOR|nr:uncharacterized protein EI97DRAFT_278996 [Westerdykella ornata]KAF2277942.1 hypothetical protein EI97DRAFT_278996 [Westerdykella ornata]